MAPPNKKNATKKVAAKKAAKKAPSNKDLAGIDLEEDTKNVTPADLKAISEMSDRHASLQLEIEEEQAYLKTLQDEAYRLETISIPEAMQTCGLKEFKTANGAAVKLKPFIQVSLPAAGTIEKAKGEEKEELELRLKEGLDWLRENGGGDIIKSLAMISFEKGQDKLKQKFVQAMLDKGYAVIGVDNVHPQTLQSFLKNKIENGVDIPTDTFKLYTGTKAEVKLPAKKK
jgi:hypothetical protein